MYYVVTNSCDKHYLLRTTYSVLDFGGRWLVIKKDLHHKLLVKGKLCRNPVLNFFQLFKEYHTAVILVSVKTEKDKGHVVSVKTEKEKR